MALIGGDKIPILIILSEVVIEEKSVFVAMARFRLLSVASLVTFILTIYVTNYLYGSAVHDPKKSSVFSILEKNPNTIVMDKQAVYLLGLSPAAWFTVYLGLLNIVDPKTILASDATQDYVDRLNLDSFYLQSIDIVTSLFLVGNMLYPALISITVQSFFAYRFFASAHTKNAEIFLDLAASFPLVTDVYATIYLTVVLFQLPNMMAWTLLLSSFAWIIWQTWVINKSIYSSAIYLWIILQIVHHWSVM